MNSPPLEVRVEGKMACFTRPENKAERVSYSVMTPSAARGTLEAIFWKPEFSYRIREIVVLEPIRFCSIFRNEVNVKASPRSSGITIEENRAQRNTLALYDVAYIIRADVEVHEGADALPAKYRDQFRRRVERGQCYHRPYLGCREFACDFRFPDTSDQPIADSRDLGLTLFDIAFGKGKDAPNIPLFFEAQLENGVLHVPDAMYNQLEVVRT